MSTPVPIQNSFSAENLLRPNIRKLVPYSSARSEYKGSAKVFLDANENAFGSPFEKNYNRYPDPLQLDLKDKLGKIKGLAIQNIFLGNGSDEAIDILFRAFCVPGKDNVIICPPTYGMYEVSAHINDVEVQKVNLIPEEFQLNTKAILDAVNVNTKLIFVCCPNNPTGNGLKWLAIEQLLNSFNGIVIVDEAYINYAAYRSLIPELLNYPNLIILQTLSKAWGMAGIRLGMAFASEIIIDIMNKIKPPYNISSATQQIALSTLKNLDQVNEWVKITVKEREQLKEDLKQLPFVVKVYPSEANFILTRVTQPDAIYHYLVLKGIITRNRSKVELCEGCLRITVGTPEENKTLLESLRNYC